MTSAASESYAPVLIALSTMQSNVDRAQKTQAHEFLEKFQKSVGPATVAFIDWALLILLCSSQKRGRPLTLF